MAVIAVNIAVGVAQEVRATRALDQNALLTRPAATVLRDGRGRAVAPARLLIGDVLTAGAGDQIALDGRVLSGRTRVDESPLTGESDPLPRRAGDAVGGAARRARHDRGRRRAQQDRRGEIAAVQPADPVSPAAGLPFSSARTWGVAAPAPAKAWMPSGKHAWDRPPSNALSTTERGQAPCSTPGQGTAPGSP